MDRLQGDRVLHKTFPPQKKLWINMGKSGKTKIITIQKNYLSKHYEGGGCIL